MRKDCKNAYDQTIAELKVKGINIESYEDLLYISQHGFMGDEAHKDEYKYYTDYIKEITYRQIKEDPKNADRWRNLYWETVKLESYWYFESYLIYMEHKRPYEKQFYLPRRKTLKVVVDDLQELEDNDNLFFYGLSMPSRVGKSTICIFFLTWIMLRRPNSHNAMGGHSGPLAKSFFKEVLTILTADEEYAFAELYQRFQPKCKLLTDKSAEDYTITLDKPDRFATLTCKGIDGTWIGAIDISGGDNFGYLYVDDLVKDRMQSLSPKRMKDTFSAYLNQMVDRRNPGSKQLMVGTLWNIYDPLKQLEEMYGNDPRYRFRKIPALNENGESNFDYEFFGFSTQWYKDMRDQMIKAGNEAEWMAKFQQAPFVREGILLPIDELGFFNGILPKDRKFRYVVNCDVAFGGGDSVSMPIGLHDEKEDIVYIVDWYFNSSGVGITVPGVVDMIIKHGIKNVTFEANAGGNLFASKIQEELADRKYLCSCDSVRTLWNMPKEDKIKASEAVIRQKFRFLDGTRHDDIETDDNLAIYERSPQYERAMAEMTTYVTEGKNMHDDAIDSISMIAERVFDTAQKRTVIMDCPF